MSVGVINCPQCGHEGSGGLLVCLDCGKVFCGYCDMEGKNPNHGTNCPRCYSPRNVIIHDYREIGEYLRNSTN